MSESNQVIKVLSGERFTPYALARKLNARAVLESATFDGGRARYSMLMVREAFRVYQRGAGVFFDDGSKKYRIRSNAKDILDVLNYFAEQHTAPRQDFPFPAGGIGFLSYEFSRFCDTIRFSDRTDPLGLPEGVFLFGHVLVIFDHYSDLLYLIGLNYAERAIDLERALKETEEAIHDLNFNYMQGGDTAYSVEVVEDPEDRIRFEDGVAKVKHEIVEGNLLQGVLSRRRRIRTDMPALEAYRRLRSANPAPYLVYLDFGEYQLFAASPEMHVRVKNGTASMRPIAGTRRRGITEDEDLLLERELLADEKELAEHLMLVDLARNDLGRVCAPGTVKLSDYHAIERYSRVMHIVSQVDGELAPGKRGIDALRATFPAGTVSGAPKIRAIETIDGIESVRRGFYAGVVAYLEPGGNLDSCITIRAGLRKGDELILQAGAGIVYDSRPEREFVETNEKLAALMRAVGLEAEA
jgi:anthranilate synthase component 1